jgi:glutamine synthetase type III
VFGQAPAEDDKLVATFLKDGHFLLASPNAYNSLGVGTTQLYNETVVYNRKRHGDFVLGGRKFAFRLKPFPKSLSKEFLLVDLVNNLDQLAESKEEVLARVRERVASYDASRLHRAAQNYGKVRTKKFFSEALKADMAPHAR